MSPRWSSPLLSVCAGLLLGGGGVVAVGSCASPATARDEMLGVAEAPALSHARGARDPRRTGTPAARAAHGCKITRSGRVFVAFADGMDLDDFETAAKKAEAMLSFLEDDLCGLAPAVDPSGALVASLDRAPLEMFELSFARADGGAADISLRGKAAEAHGKPTTFHVLVTQHEDRWTATLPAAH